MPKKAIRRSRTGCITCRLSKKKCDEIKPICSFCTKKEVKCIWPEVPSQTLTQYINERGTCEIVDHIVKRVRRTRSGCDHCRKIKKKCDESKPNCQRCLKKNVACTWQGRDYSNLSNGEETDKLSSVSGEESEVENGELNLMAKTTENIYFNNIKIQINDESSQMHLFKIFFNNIIDGLSPKISLKFISDLTFDSLRDSPEFRNVVASLSAAFVCTADDSNRKVIDCMHNQAISSLQRNSMTIESKLHSLDFCILRALYTKTDNQTLLAYINMALDLVLQYNPMTPSLKFKVIVESLIYHFAVSIITISDKSLDIHNPFIICDALRQYYPEFPDSNSNLLLGSALDIFIVVAKVSYIYKSGNVSTEIVDVMQEQIDCLLDLQPMKLAPVALTLLHENADENDITVDIAVPVSLTRYVTLFSCKLLLLHITPDTDNNLLSNIVEKILFVLKNSQNYDTEIEICGLWGLFMLGLNLKEISDQDFMAKYFNRLWEKSHNLGYLKAISLMRYAWKRNIGFDILNEKSFLKHLCLN